VKAAAAPPSRREPASAPREQPAAPAPEAGLQLALRTQSPPGRGGGSAGAPPPDAPRGGVPILRRCPACHAALAAGRPAPGGCTCAAGRAATLVHTALAGGGAPLDRGSRGWFEERLGHGFGHVRVHTGPAADASARAVGAQAYTVGSDVVFRDGHHAPHRPGGRWLMAHELAHVAQADRGRAPRLAAHPAPGALLVGAADDALEREADAVADRAVSSAPAPFAAPAVSRFHASAPVRRCAACDEATRLAGEIQRKCAACEELESVQRKGDGGLAAAMVPDPGRVLRPAGGRPLDAATRAFFEGRLGRDLSAVRVHEGREASAAARSVRALAYTVGPNVVFRDGQYRPDTEGGKRLLAHELAHVAQQGHAPARTAGGAAGVSRAPGRVQRKLDPLASLLPQREIEKAPYREVEEAIEAAEDFVKRFAFVSDLTPKVEENLALLNRERDLRKAMETRRGFNAAQSDFQGATGGSSIHRIGLVALDKGSYLYRTPDPNRPYVRALPLNTRMAVVRKTGSGWYYVVFQDSTSGYVPASDVNIDLPDPGARLYRIQQGEGAQAIVKKHYTDFVWGQDERFYVNVLAFVNHEAGRRGIIKPSLDADWSTTVTHAGSQIWIPGQEYAKALKGSVSSGSFTYEAWQSVKNAAAAVGEFLLGSAAFVAGLLHGALESLWDLLAGLVDLVGMVGKLIVSIVTGELGNDLSKLWDVLTGLNPGELFDSAVDWLDKKWNAPGIWDRWHFRGWLLGYLAMEVAMMFFSGGLLSGLKWVGKSATVSKLMAKLPMLARIAKRAELLAEGAHAVKLRQGVVRAGEALAAARKWAGSVLRIPADILADLTLDAINRLKKLPEWAMERLSELSPKVLRAVLGCTSPCKVKIEEIIKYLGELAGKAGNRLTSKAEVLKALPGDLNTTKIAEYLDTHPALMEAIRKAELTDADFGKLGAFLSDADKAAGKGEEAYETFVRYLTQVVPAKTGNDIGKLNQILNAVSKTGGQGRAIKGAMFEAWARVHVPHFANKSFVRATFEDVGSLVLAKGRRTSDFFIGATGELWDFKHALTRVGRKQAQDYLKILNHTEPGLPKVKSIHYLFPDKAAAETSRYLLTEFGFDVHYLDAAGVMQRL
jgi:hypothetical protein